MSARDGLVEVVLAPAPPPPPGLLRTWWARLLPPPDPATAADYEAVIGQARARGYELTPAGARHAANARATRRGRHAR